METGDNTNKDSEKNAVPTVDLTKVNTFGIPRTKTTELPLPKAVHEVIEKVYAIAQDRIRMRQAEQIIVDLVNRRKETKKPKRVVDSVVTDRKKLEAQQGFPMYQKLAFQRWVKHLPEHFRQRYFAVALYLKPVSERLNQELHPENENPIITPILIEHLIKQVGHIYQMISLHMPEDKSQSEVNVPYPIVQLIAYIKYLDMRTKEENFDYDEDKIKQELAQYRSGFEESLEGIDNAELKNLAKEVLFSLEDPDQEGDVKDIVEGYKLSLSQLPDWNLVLPQDVDVDMVRVVGKTRKSLERWDRILQALDTLKDNEENNEMLVANIRLLAQEIEIFTDNYELLLDSFAREPLSKVSFDVPGMERGVLMKIIKDSTGILTLLKCVQPDIEGKYSKNVMTVLRQAIEKFDSLKSLLRFKSDELDEEKNSEKDQNQQDEIEDILSALNTDKDFKDKYKLLLDSFSFLMSYELRNAKGMIDMAQQNGENGDLGPQVETAITVLQEMLERLVVSSIKTTNDTISTFEIFPHLQSKVAKLKKFREKVNSFTEDMDSKMHLFPKLFDALNKGQKVNLAQMLLTFSNLLKLMDNNTCLGDLCKDKPEIEWHQLSADLEKLLSQKDQSRNEIKEMAKRVSNFQTGMTGIPQALAMNPDLIDHDLENISTAHQGVYSARILIESLKEQLEVEENDNDQIDFMNSVSTKVSDVLARAKVALLQCLDRDIDSITEVMMIIERVEATPDINEQLVQLIALETNLYTLPFTLKLKSKKADQNEDFDQLF